MEKIKEIIIEQLKETNKFSEKRIKEAINKIERMTIKKSTFFSKFLYKTFDAAGIIHVDDLFELTIEQACELLKLNTRMMKKYIKDIEEKIEDAIIRQDKKRSNKKQAINIENKLKIMIKEIKNNEGILKLLREEILYKETYNELNIGEQRIKKPFYYSKLDLNNYELSILRKILLKMDEYNTKDPMFNEAVVNIYKNLHFFIKKIQYKTIIDKNYFDLEDLNFSTSEIRFLNRLNINYVSELIELKNLSSTRHVVGKLKTSITNALYEKNIIIPKDINEINEVLIQENAGIKDKRIIK